MEPNDDDDELNSNESLYRHLLDDCQRMLYGGVGGGRQLTGGRPAPRCPCPTKTDRGCGPRVLTGTAVRSCQPRARPPPPPPPPPSPPPPPPPSPSPTPPVRKKTSEYRLPECRPVSRGAVTAAARCCGDCSKTVGRDRDYSAGPSCRPPCTPVPSFWSAVGGCARAAACWAWAKKSYFFVAVASFALGLYADDYCHCVYESDY